MTYKFLISNFTRANRAPFLSGKATRVFSSKSKDNIEIPVNPLKDVYSANEQKENGVIYDKKPFKITCEEGKTYHWCLCGQSKTQPFCDGTHNNIFMKIKLKPIKFTVTKTKEYWLCNCKQTKNRPFCDGTHKNEDIQGFNVFKKST